MDFNDYETRINEAVAAASPEQAETFALGVLRRMLPFVAQAEREALLEEEAQLLDQALAMVESGDLDVPELAQLLDRLTELGEDDDERVIDIHGDITEFLAALDWYRQYREDGDRESLAGISAGILNILDFYHSEDDGDDWLEVPELRSEFDAQMAALGAAD